MKENLFPNLFLLGLSSSINIFSIFFLQYILSIFLTIEIFGLYSSILSICFIILPLINFGFSPYIIKNHFQNKYDSYEEFKKSILAVFFLSLILLLFFILVLLFILNISSIFIVTVFSLHLLALSYFEIIYSVYQSNFNFYKILIISIIFNLLKLFLIFIFLLFNENLNLLNVSYVYLISSTIILLIFIFKFRDILFNDQQQNIFSIKKYFLILKKTYTFGIHGSVFYIYYFFDIIIIYIFTNPEFVSNYSLSLSFLFFLNIIPTIIIDKYFVNQFHINFQKKNIFVLKKIRNNLILFFLSLSLTAYLFIYYFAESLIILLYDQKYIYLIDLLLIMSLSIFFRYITIIFNGTLYLGKYLIICSYFWLCVSLIKIMVNSFLLINYNILYLSYSFVFFEILVLFIFMFFHFKSIHHEK